MTAQVVGVLAEALAEHALSEIGEWDHVRGRSLDKCRCGKVFRDTNDHLTHQASVVAALPNIAIVQLPEPAFQEDGTWEWCSARSRNAVWINDDGLIEDRFGIGQEPEDVRMWAADLLAAVARAAGGQG